MADARHRLAVPVFCRAAAVHDRDVVFSGEELPDGGGLRVQELDQNDGQGLFLGRILVYVDAGVSVDHRYQFIGVPRRLRSGVQGV